MDTVQQIVAQLTQGDFAAVEHRFSGHVKPYAGQIQAFWQDLEQQVGAFQEQGKPFAVQTQQGLAQVVTCIFEQASIDINIVLSPTGEIVGLTITPVGTLAQLAPPQTSFLILPSWEEARSLASLLPHPPQP